MKVTRKLTYVESGEYPWGCSSSELVSCFDSKESPSSGDSLGKMIAQLIIRETYVPNDNISGVIDDILDELEEFSLCDPFLETYILTKKAICAIYCTVNGIPELNDHLHAITKAAIAKGE